jgi:hypothetical protein
MISGGSLIFAAKEWITPAAFAFGAALLLIAWSYFRTSAPRGLRIACAALKLLGVAALLLCLLEPTWSDQRAKPGANIAVILADNSASMTLRGRGEQQTRAEALQRVAVGEASGWRTELAKNFGVRNYVFDSRLQPSENFHELNFSGRSSAIGTSLKALVDRYRGEPLAGIFLLSDGVASDLTGAEVEGLPPIYPVIFGSDAPPRDLAIGSTTVTQSAFEDAPVTVQADVAAIGAGWRADRRPAALDRSGAARRLTAPRGGADDHCSGRQREDRFPLSVATGENRCAFLPSAGDCQGRTGKTAGADQRSNTREQ